VFVNGSAAQNGEAIYNGNLVTTGAGSSGLINLDGGGSLQLDENTDPVFRFQLIKEGWCLVVNIASGQMFADTHSGSCVQINTPDGSGVVASSVNVHVGNSGSTWTVLQGAVRLVRPAGTLVHPFESVMVRKGKVVSTRRVSSDELARLTEWRFKYTASALEGFRIRNLPIRHCHQG
jgi:FecR protein